MWKAEEQLMFLQRKIYFKNYKKKQLADQNYTSNVLSIA